MTLTNEQVDFITTGDSDTQTGLPEPENTIQVIRSLNASEENAYYINYEQLTVEIDGYIARFNTIQEMYNYISTVIG